jgi:hypothetical protein
MTLEKRELPEREHSNLWMAARTLYEAMNPAFNVLGTPVWNALTDNQQQIWFEYARVTTWSFRSQLHLAEMSQSSLTHAVDRLRKLSKNRLEKMRLLRMKVSGWELSQKQERFLK